MNFSFYTFGTPNSYNQYPADSNSILLQEFAQRNTTESQLSVYRKGQLVYYAFSRKLHEKSNNYLGFCLVFNGIYCDNPKKLFNLFDKTFYDVQLKGELLRFEKEKCFFVVDKFIEKPIEFERIKTFFKNELENNFNRDFYAIPASFKINNGKKSISVKEADSDILAAITEFDIVHISNNEKSLSELERTHKMLTDLYTEKQELDKKHNKLKVQKKQYKVVLLLCFVLLGCAIGLFAFNENLRSKDNQISNLNKELTQKQTDIKGLNTDIAKLQVVRENLSSKNSRLTNEVSQLTDRNIELTTTNEQLNSEITDKNSKIRVLESQKYSYRKENNILQSKNRKLSSDVETYKKYEPQTYKTISDANYYYKYKCGESYKKTSCYTKSGNSISIYTIAKEYGLTDYGWVKMEDLKKGF